jgi:hypothetical protein
MEDGGMSDARNQRRALQRAWPAEFADGIRCGLLPGPDTAPPRDAGGYPQGFHGWPLERCNAWFAGFNFGYSERKKRGEATHER